MSSAHHLTLGREMVEIHWKINNATGHGSPVEEHMGRAWVAHRVAVSAMCAPSRCAASRGPRRARRASRHWSAAPRAPRTPRPRTAWRARRPLPARPEGVPGRGPASGQPRVKRGLRSAWRRAPQGGGTWRQDLTLSLSQSCTPAARRRTVATRDVPAAPARASRRRPCRPGRLAGGWLCLSNGESSLPRYRLRGRCQRSHLRPAARRPRSARR